MTRKLSLSDRPEFTALLRQKERLQNRRIPELFSEQPSRANDYVVAAANVELDYSRHVIDDEALATLLRIVDATNGNEFAHELFSGFEVNFTEKRPALHYLFRYKNKKKKTKKLAEVSSIQAQMQSWVKKITDGNQKGFTGKPITDIVNLGIGGSNLGPKLVLEALRNFRNHLGCHFVANLDPEDLKDTLSKLSPETTLFVVCSKSFTTEETLTNAENARDWLIKAGAENLEGHFLAVTENIKAAEDFLIPTENCLYLPKWVGGRYSIWSSAGFTCALGVGWKLFCEFLSGAEAMDIHFKSAPSHENLPMLMSLLELWYRNCWNTQVHAVIPYCYDLRSLPNYLQQLIMESNGKSTLASGDSCLQDTSPVIWGADGINGQHSFYQLLHQGTVMCPVDFIMPLKSTSGESFQHAKLIAHCLAQARTLMTGRSTDHSYNYLINTGMSEKCAKNLANHLRMSGNRPSSILCLESLRPATLGSLIALYEHKTYFSARLWEINPFDQWGVELGKEVSANIQATMLQKTHTKDLDPATLRLIAKWRKANKRN